MVEIWTMEVPHPTVSGRMDRVMHLTKIQTFDLMTGYNTELRIKVNRIWERYDKVIRDCCILNENYEKLNLPKIGDIYSKDSKGRKYKEFNLTQSWAGVI
jgi:hypothetical protein